MGAQMVKQVLHKLLMRLEMEQLLLPFLLNQLLMKDINQLQLE
jgi:hypothetical protein